MQKLKNIASKSVYWLKVISLGLMLGLGIQFAQAWVNPGATPPGGNVSGPLTTGATAQWKTGTLGIGTTGPAASGIALEVNGQAKAIKYYDGNDLSYFVDPNSTSVMSTIYSYGNIVSTSRNYSVTDDWALTTYTAAWDANAQPQNPRGSLYVNDILLRSTGKWASEIKGIVASTCPANQYVYGFDATGGILCRAGSGGGGGGASCVATPVSWSSFCGGSAPAAGDLQMVNVVDPVSGCIDYTGQASYQCNNGTWVFVGGGSCSLDKCN